MAAPSPVNRTADQKSHPLFTVGIQRFVGAIRNTMPIPATTVYNMRAKRTDTGAFVYWSVNGAVDTTGKGSGVSTSILSDIVIVSIVEET